MAPLRWSNIMVTGAVEHVDGNYHKAWLPKASEENEHADVMMWVEDWNSIT